MDRLLLFMHDAACSELLVKLIRYYFLLLVGPAINGKLVLGDHKS